MKANRHTNIKTVPLGQLITHRAFLKKLYCLGLSARNKQEKAFSAHCYYNDPSNIRISPVVEGGITKVERGFSRKKVRAQAHKSPPGFDSLMKIHNHPSYRARPEIEFVMGDIFSLDDLSYLGDGNIEGLVSVPLGRESLLFLLAQAAHQPDKQDDDLVYSPATFMAELKRALALETTSPEESWMRSAVKSMRTAGYNAFAVRFDFPLDCTEERFIAAAHKNVVFGDQKDIRFAHEWHRFIEEQDRLWRESGGESESEHLWEETMGSIDLVSTRFERMTKRAVSEYENAVGKRIEEAKGLPEVDIEFLLYREQMGYVDLTEWVKNKKTFPAGNVELAFQMVKEGTVQAVKVSMAWGVHILVKATELEGIEVLSAWDVAVKLDLPLRKILTLIEEQKISPDFVLESEAGNEYVFLKIPNVPNS